MPASFSPSITTLHDVALDYKDSFAKAVRRNFGSRFVVTLIARDTAANGDACDVILSDDAREPLVAAIERRMGRPAS